MSAPLQQATFHHSAVARQAQGERLQSELFFEALRRQLP